MWETRKLSDLKVSNPYLRLGTDVSELEKSIKTVGLIAPLVISPKNLILAGGRRYQAMLNLGFIEAPVMIVDKDELESELISIDENLVRKDLNKMEMEGHLRRAKEIYQALHPYESEAVEEVATEQDSEEEGAVKKAPKEVLPAAKFLHMVSEKTGLSPKQIHQAIGRDEQAHQMVKDARKNGELSISQTNELIKLKKEEQEKALGHLKDRPVREIRQFVKMAKTKGVEEAMRETPRTPHAREFIEIESSLKKLKKQLKQLSMEGIDLSDLPQATQKLMKEVIELAQSEGEGHGRFQSEETESSSAWQ